MHRYANVDLCEWVRNQASVFPFAYLLFSELCESLDSRHTVCRCGVLDEWDNEEALIDCILYAVTLVTGCKVRAFYLYPETLDNTGLFEEAFKANFSAYILKEFGSKPDFDKYCLSDFDSKKDFPKLCSATTGVVNGRRVFQSRLLEALRNGEMKSIYVYDFKGDMAALPFERFVGEVQYTHVELRRRKNSYLLGAHNEYAEVFDCLPPKS